MNGKLAAFSVVALAAALVLPVPARAFDEWVESTEVRTARPLTESVVKEESQETTTTTTTTESHRARPVHRVVVRPIVHRHVARPMVSESTDTTVEETTTTVNRAVPVYVPPRVRVERRTFIEEPEPITVERSRTFIEREPLPPPYLP